MSGKTNVQGNRSNPKKRNRSRSRRKSKQQNKNDHNGLSSYQDVSFLERPSSGRPGSPQRYFEDSYDVSFNANAEVDFLSHIHSQASHKDADKMLGEQTCAPSEVSKPIDDGDRSMGNNGEANPAHSSGKQVVHRHLNGLCVITAGNLLSKIIDSNQIGTMNNAQGTQHIGGNKIEISSIQYLVQVGQDSISARGKIRTKNKKQKRVGKEVAKNGEDDAKESHNHEVEDHDGNVSPNDPLCQITLSNGTSIELKCCVLGTVIELNHRLLGPEISGTKFKEEESTRNGGNATHASGEGAATIPGGDPSLILKEPLLDGYLAVIIPAKGSFPPKTKSVEDKRV